MNISTAKRCAISAIIVLSTFFIACRSNADSYKEMDLTFTGAQGAMISGTLTVPDSAKPGDKIPLLLMISDGGGVDRNGNLPPRIQSNLYRDIAHEAAGNGIASYRFDMRNVAQATSKGMSWNATANYIAFDNYVEDAVSAYKMLIERSELDPGRFAIFGHGMGALYALCAAEQLTQNGQSVSALVLAAGSGKTYEQLINASLVKELVGNGKETETYRIFAKKNHDVLNAIRKNGQVPANIFLGLVSLYPPYMGKYIQGALEQDPTKLAHSYSGPVLLLAGANDMNYPPNDNCTLLDKALSERKGDDHTYYVSPDTSHFFKKSSAASPSGFSGPVQPDVLSKLDQWLSLKWKLNK
jgi:dienelactone hydrolase